MLKGNAGAISLQTPVELTAQARAGIGPSQSDRGPCIAGHTSHPEEEPNPLVRTQRAVAQFTRRVHIMAVGVKSGCRHGRLAVNRPIGQVTEGPGGVALRNSEKTLSFEILEKEGHRYKVKSTGEMLGFYHDWRKNDDAWSKILPLLEEEIKQNWGYGKITDNEVPSEVEED